jgi:hypothetical protein
MIKVLVSVKNQVSLGNKVGFFSTKESVAEVEKYHQIKKKSKIYGFKISWKSFKN